jgi:phage host-nuclease inhibitor protein Gam
MAKKNGNNGTPQALQNWQEVDQSLKRLGEITISLDQIEGEMNLRINEVKTSAVTKAQLIKTEAKAIEKKISLFCEDNKAEFAKSRSKTFDFGTIAYRVTKQIKIISEPACIKALKTLGLLKCLSIKEKVNKEAMEALDDNTLAKLGVERKVTDSLKIEPNLDKLRVPVATP